jgi:hypothetical protein
MEPDKQLLEAWENGVQLGHAWWAFADADNKKRFRDLQREGTGSHLGLQRSLEIDLVARLSAGELQAIGIEGGSDPRPVSIPQYYFSKRAEIDWDEETIAAFGKKFHEVRVQGPREPQDTMLTEPEIVDPRLIRGEWESADEPLQSEPEPSNEPIVHEGPQSLDRMPPVAPALPDKRRMGRPPLVPIQRSDVEDYDWRQNTFVFALSIRDIFIGFGWHGMSHDEFEMVYSGDSIQCIYPHPKPAKAARVFEHLALAMTQIALRRRRT